MGSNDTGNRQEQQKPDRQDELGELAEKSDGLAELLAQISSQTPEEPEQSAVAASIEFGGALLDEIFPAVGDISIPGVPGSDKADEGDNAPSAGFTASVAIKVLFGDDDGIV